MTIEVELPDGSVAEFPDGTSNKTIEMALSRYRAKPEPKPLKASNYNPTGVAALNPVTRQGGALLDGLQHRLTDLPLGIAQLAGNAVNSGVQAVAGDTEWGQGVNARNEAQNQQVAEREADYQQRTGDTAGSYVGSGLGQALPWVRGLQMARAAGILPSLARTRDVAGVAAKARNVATKVGLLAAEGATVAATLPVTNGEPFWEQKGANVAIGAGATPLVAAGGAGAIATLRGGRQAARYLTPGGRETIANQRLAGLLGDDPNILNTLQNVPQYVPGEIPTIGQALATPQALQLDRGLRNNPHAGPAFVERESANNAARMGLLRTLGGTDDALETAVQTRRANANAFRGPNLPEQGGAMIDPQGIVATLERLSLSGNDTVRGAARKHLGLLREHMEQNGGRVPATALDDIRQGVGSTLRSIPRTGVVAPQEAALYDPVSAQIADTLDGAVPGYRDYLSAYARDSAPINDMGAARRLIDDSSLAGLDGSGGQVLSIPKLRQTLRLDDRAGYPMTDGARDQMENILRSLQRRSITDNKVAASGPGTAAEVGATLLDSPLVRAVGAGGGGILGTMTGGPIGGVLGLLATEGAGAARRDITRRVGRKAANAQEAAAALRQAQLDAQRRRQGLLGQVPQYLLPYATP